MMKLPAAALWDMDGTIVDTERYWIESETRLIEEHGGSWTYTDALRLVGLGLWDSAALIREIGGVPLDPDEIVARLARDVEDRIRTEGAPFRPGARELLAEFTAAGVPQALVTMSTMPLALAIAETLPEDTFRFLVTGENVTRPKPFPDPYLEGARLLEVAIDDCVAFEDSPTGVRSAVASGAVTFAVPNEVPLDPTSGAILLDTLDGVTLTTIADHVARTPRNGAAR